ncbi:nucleotidyltransferase family protein [Rhodocyclaceae bacterium SMB388]
MKPSEALQRFEDKVRRTLALYPVRNPRVFGSVLHGTDEDHSDLDLLVDAAPGATLFDLGKLEVSLEEILGVPVHVVTPGDLPARIRQRVVSEARTL